MHDGKPRNVSVPLEARRAPYVIAHGVSLDHREIVDTVDCRN